MPTFQYISKAGAPATIDAADETSALKSITGLADPSSGVRLMPATSPAPVAPAAPTAPVTPDYSKAAEAAGAAGLGAKDYQALLGPTPEEQKAAQDEIAKQFGFENADAFFKDAFSKPSQTTEQFYKDAYTAAGIPDLVSKISSKKNALASALNTVNDNPWYDEAFRRGEASRLQTLANVDISNLQDEYNLRLGHVHDLVTQHATDLGQEDKIRSARLSYLQTAAKTAAESAAQTRASSNLSSYLKGKESTQKPQTVTAPTTSNVYSYDPVTGGFKLVQTAVPKAPSSKSSSKAAPQSQEQKTVAAFNKAVANRTTLTKAGTREQFIRQLQAQYPQIDPNDIARKVYDTYPDHFDGK